MRRNDGRVGRGLHCWCSMQYLIAVMSWMPMSSVATVTSYLPGATRTTVTPSLNPRSCLISSSNSSVPIVSSKNSMITTTLLGGAGLDDPESMAGPCELLEELGCEAAPSDELELKALVIEDDDDDDVSRSCADDDGDDEKTASGIELLPDDDEASETGAGSQTVSLRMKPSRQRRQISDIVGSVVLSLQIAQLSVQCVWAWHKERKNNRVNKWKHIVPTKRRMRTIHPKHNRSKPSHLER